MIYSRPRGLVALAGLLDSIVQGLDAHVAAVLAQPNVVERIRALSDAPTPFTPAALKQQLVSDISKWTSVIDAAKIERI